MFEKPPVSVDVGGIKYNINSDFRVMMEFEEMIYAKPTKDQEAFAQRMMQFDDDLTFEDACMNAKYYEALNSFYCGSIPDDIGEAFEKLLWFYRCGKEINTKKTGKAAKRIYSFKHDADYINAAFLQDYKLDLTEVQYMHWWKFMSLFTSLRDECKICEIMGWRGADLKELGKEERKKVKKMQKLYAFPDDTTKEDKDLLSKVTEALARGDAESIDMLLSIEQGGKT